LIRESRGTSDAKAFAKRKKEEEENKDERKGMRGR